MLLTQVRTFSVSCINSCIQLYVEYWFFFLYYLFYRSVIPCVFLIINLLKWRIALGTEHEQFPLFGVENTLLLFYPAVVLSFPCLSTLSCAQYPVAVRGVFANWYVCLPLGQTFALRRLHRWWAPRQWLTLLLERVSSFRGGRGPGCSSLQVMKPGMKIVFPQCKPNGLNIVVALYIFTKICASSDIIMTILLLVNEFFSWRNLFFLLNHFLVSTGVQGLAFVRWCR